jgi:hypothetical protein
MMMITLGFSAAREARETEKERRRERERGRRREEGFMGRVWRRGEAGCSSIVSEDRDFIDFETRQN